MRSDTIREKSLALVFFVAVLEVIDVNSCPANCKSKTGCIDADGGCSECVEGWFGRQCNHPLECYTGRGYHYYGTISKTEYNVTCKSWSQEPPSSYPWTNIEKQKNYCRNPYPPANDPGPWCYQISGNRLGYCLVPRCNTQCPAPDLMVFGDVINPPTSGFVKGFVVEVVSGGCGAGNRGKMTCQEDLTWSKGFECAAIPAWCKNPTTVSEPAYTVENRKAFYYLDNITVLCRDGYEIVSSKQITCQADKSWSAMPQCTRVKCDKPSLSQNSKISKNIKSSYKYEDEIIITCLPGYDIIGQTAFKCLANKQWNGTLPTCKVVECNQPILTENSYVQNKKNTYIYRDQINIKCDIGYTRKGTASFTCGADKLWSGTFPTCEPVPCQPPPLPPHTVLKSQLQSYVYKDQVTLTCEKGYELKDKDTITCLANQTWGAIPGCTIVKCRDPELPTSFIILEGNKTEYQYRDRAVVGCKENYEFNGTNTTTCLHTGQWQEINAQCTGVPCKPPELPPNTELQSPQKNYVYKDEVRIKCKKGYKLDDRETITCLANQTWGTIPGCSKICDGLSTAQLVGITLGFSLMSGIVSAFITIFVTRRYLHTDKTKETVPKNSVTKTNEAFEYDVIDVNMRDEPNVYSVIPK